MGFKTLGSKKVNGGYINEHKADAALKELYLSNYLNIEKYILANHGTKEDAKDIYQEAFLVYWRNMKLGKFSTFHSNSISGYLLQIAKNKWIDILRREKRMNFVPLDEESQLYDLSEDLNEEEKDYIDIVKKHYDELGEPCKTLLKLFYFHKESMKEIAKFFSWTDATAKNNKYRCLQRLRDKVTDL